MGDIGDDDNSTVVPTSSESDAKFEKTSMDNCSLNKAGTPFLSKKGGRLFSGFIGLNILLLACVLVSSSAFSTVQVVEREVLAMLCILMGITAWWMIMYLTWTAKKKNYRNLKDSHAGPIWLRVGLAAFGVCTLVLDVLKICKSAGLVHCESPIKIVFPVFQGVFVIIQTYFLWVASKDCVQIHMNFTRCGLMLTLCTNLSIWMAAVTEESLHQTPSEGGHRMLKAGGGSPGCDCNTSVCQTFETGYYYLYPFNIEYSLFASALSYVMWKNVGRVLDNDSHSAHHSVRLPNLFVGLTCGVGVLVAGLAIFIIYEIDITSSEYRDQALKMFYIFNIVALSLMSLGCLAGTLIFRLDQRDADSHKNPTRSLDVGLLIIAALGKYVISYFSVIAIVAKSAEKVMDIFNLVYSLLMIVQHTFQNIFIIEGIHRQPVHDGHGDHHNPVEHDAGHEMYINTMATSSHGNHHNARHDVHANAMATSSHGNHHNAGHGVPLNAVGTSSHGNHHNAGHDVHVKAVGTSSHGNHHNAVEHNAGHEGHVNAVGTSSHGNHEGAVHGHEADMNHHGEVPHSCPRRTHLDWRRKVVKELSLFLLFSNIIFWIIPAFGGRPEFDNDRELSFYGNSMWTAIVNIGLPFGIFYRMHAVASLLEVYVIS